MDKLRGDAKVIVALVGGQEEALLEVTEEGEARVYGAEDWRDETSPSYGRDGGNLRQHDGSRFYGPVLAVHHVEPAAAEAILRATWPDQNGLFLCEAAA